MTTQPLPFDVSTPSPGYIQGYLPGTREPSVHLADFPTDVAGLVDDALEARWVSLLSVRDAVNAAVKAHGVNGVTRKTIFEQLNKIHQFDANGMLAPIDLAGRKVSKCSVTMQVKNGQFVRVNPTKAGTFDCPANGSIERKLDLLGS